MNSDPGSFILFADINCNGSGRNSPSKQSIQERISANINLYCSANFGGGYSRGALIATSSFPSIARGNSMALNSAPTRITSETIYIQTSNEMPAPSDP